MTDLTLYHASPSRSSIVLWMLEEIGEPYDIKLLRLSDGDQLKPAIWPSTRWARCRRFSTKA
jgi:glutathione S-transferase